MPGTDPAPGPDPAAVGRALAALADPDESSDQHAFVDVIADASDAFSDITTAARFLDAGGDVRLRRAVGAATREDHHSAREGHRLLRDLTRLRASLDALDTLPSGTSSESPARRDGDHFHSGRTTVFSGGVESPDR
ncbi:hypothetical protein GJR96_01055 [Haloferax sp. MBLA0076]|uniref:Uncharacterized protein n=1 Tax=Haloferax litoreum TaxID=2666140 RepID=A0A6A8GBR6_9EURY|nr:MULTISPECIES: hypothetical protein [Haloferax]KAB1192101.1 hypothetical protein Hfx1148_01055 [Haloferax sp. CBA1148]MRX20548.1 hypothetical protein [Haloferax litoreum]